MAEQRTGRADDWIAEQRRIEQAATEGPWEYDGCGKITQRFSLPEPRATVVSTDVACMSYCYGGSASGVERDEDAEFIVDARTALPKALAALEAVLALHRRVGIYDDCECDDKTTPEHEDIYELGVTCNKVYEICAACCRDDVYQSEECANYHQHDTGGHYCPSGTVAAIAEALGVES